MDKYRKTARLLLVACVLYLLVIFFVKNQWITIAAMVITIGLCVWNMRLGKQAKTLSAQIQELKGPQAETEEIVADDAGRIYEDLDHLPRKYTVLDNVKVDEAVIPHVIASPYELIVIGTEDDRKKIQEVVAELELDAPVIVFADHVPMSELSAYINSERAQAMNEDQVFRILYRLNDID